MHHFFFPQLRGELFAPILANAKTPGPLPLQSLFETTDRKENFSWGGGIWRRCPWRALRKCRNSFNVIGC
jgi:hypothetical protein